MQTARMMWWNESDISIELIQMTTFDYACPCKFGLFSILHEYEIKCDPYAI